MVQVMQTEPLVMGADEEDCEKGQRYVKVRYRSLAQAQFANQQLYLAQEALQHTQEDLRLTRWRAKRNGLLLSRAEARAKCYAWAAWILAGVAVTALLWRSA